MKVIIFGGTSEGRMLSECLCRNKIAHTLCVATDYGEEVLEPSEYAHVLQGRLDTQQMADLIQSEQCLVVVDATHPYAVEVSKNIRKACEMTEMKYLRFLRAEEAVIDVKNDVIVSSAAEAAAYLDGQEAYTRRSVCLYGCSHRCRLSLPAGNLAWKENRSARCRDHFPRR